MSDVHIHKWSFLPPRNCFPTSTTSFLFVFVFFFTSTISLLRTPAAEAASPTVLACDGFGKKLCYSCASDLARHEWHDTYEHSFTLPANFSHYCNNPTSVKDRLQLVTCQSSCVTFVDPQFVFANPVGKHYIRGCLDTMFKSSHSKNHVQRMFSTTSVETEQCRPVPRTELFNSLNVRADNVTVCVCACDRCNIYPYSISGYSNRGGWRRRTVASDHSYLALICSLLVVVIRSCSLCIL